MKRNRIGIGILVLATLLVGMALIPAVSAQKEDNYSVTAEKAFEHANAQMIQFIITNTEGVENWAGASIDPKPLEIYDINGQKLYYQFSVYKNSNLMGRIDIGANKTIGQSVRLVELDPKTFNAAEAMDKSIETAKTKYPTGEIMSTKMVVYDYPEIGAMTMVKDKTQGDEHRIFVDAYTLDVIPDQPATKTEPGVWSMYEKVVKNKIDENLKKWQNSDELVKSIEQAATDKGVNINVPVTEENIKKLRDNTTIASKTVQKTIISPANFGYAQKLLSVPVYSQATTYYCVPASAAMITAYYKGSSPSQSSIYKTMKGVAPNGIDNSRALLYYKSSKGLNKPNSYSSFDVRYFADIRTEIDNNRPLQSNTATHARVCVGYQYNGYLTSYLRLNNPWPNGHSDWEAFGSESDRIYVK